MKIKKIALFSLLALFPPICLMAQERNIRTVVSGLNDSWPTGPTGSIAVGADGSIFVMITQAGWGFCDISMIPPGGGSPIPFYGSVGCYNGIAVDAEGAVYYGDPDRNQVLKISDGVSRPIATDLATGSIAVDSAGRVFVATVLSIQRIDTNGTVSNILHELDPAVGSKTVAVDNSGNVFYGFHRSLYKIPAGGDGGNRSELVASDVGFTFAREDSRHLLAVDASGHPIFSDRLNHRVMRVGDGGTLEVIAGTGSSGFSGDDSGPATEAELDRPTGLAVEGSGRILVFDQRNDRIRRIGLPVAAEDYFPTPPPCPACPDYPPVCGNGVVERGEFCDDGNLTSGDGCSNHCIRDRRLHHHGWYKRMREFFTQPLELK